MIYFVIPLYNERNNIANLKKELLYVLPDEKKFFVFSDDGSKDDTAAVIKSEFRDLNFIVLGNGINRGPGAAFNAGFEWVLKNSHNNDDCVVTIEADCTSDPAILPQMLSLARMGYDLVLASVYAQSGGFEKTTWIRRFISAIANITMRFAFNVRVLTLSSFYRVYTIDLLKKLKATHQPIIREPGFICMLEILIKSIRMNAKIIEVPTTLRSSKRIGKSKMKLVSTSLQYIRFLFKNSF